MFGSAKWPRALIRNMTMRKVHYSALVSRKKYVIPRREVKILTWMREEGAS